MISIPRTVLLWLLSEGICGSPFRRQAALSTVTLTTTLYFLSGFFPPRHFIQMEASSVFFAAGFFHLVQHFFEKSFQSFVKLSSNLSRVFTVMSRMGCLEESQSS